MTPELAQVVPGRGAATKPATALFQIEQSNLDAGRVTFTLNPDEDVLGIAAAVLPARLVNAREGDPDRHEHALLYRWAEALTQVLLIPVLQADKPFQLCRHQQRLPLPGLLSRAAVDQFRHLHAEPTKCLQRLQFAQHRGPAERMQRRAIQVANLPFAVQQRLLRIAQPYPLHTAFAGAALVGFLDPFALGVPPALKGAGTRFAGRQYERSTHAQPRLRST